MAPGHSISSCGAPSTSGFGAGFLGSPAKSRAGRATVVSLTPVSLSGDSRTLKAAMAYVRFGFESVVIEGIASTQSFAAALPITVHRVASGRRGALRRAGHD